MAHGDAPAKFRQVAPHLGLQLDLPLLHQDQHTRQRRHHLRERCRIKHRVLRHRFLRRQQRTLTGRQGHLSLTRFKPKYRTHRVPLGHRLGHHGPQRVKLVRVSEGAEKEESERA